MPKLLIGDLNKLLCFHTNSSFHIARQRKEKLEALTRRLKGFNIDQHDVNRCLCEVQILKVWDGYDDFCEALSLIMQWLDQLLVKFFILVSNTC